MEKSSRKMVSLILAAGKGTRMDSPNLHKVCFPLEGRPVIARAIEGYQRVGIERHFVVVGQMADQVMEAASAAPGSHYFAFQTEQRGTGNAAKTAATLLEAMDYDGDVLVVAGDKVIEDAILDRLIADFRASNSDLAFIVGDVEDFPSSGRVIYRGDSDPIGIVEVFDFARTQLLQAMRRIAQERPIPAEDAENMAISYLKQEKKAMVALGPLWDSIKAGEQITSDMIDADFGESDFEIRVGNGVIPQDLFADVRHANLSVYLFKAQALYDALAALSSDNAQHEEYLTDTIGILASRGGRLRTVAIDYPQQVMAFNTRAELRAIEQYIESRKAVTVTEPPRTIRPVGEWLRSFDTADASAIGYLSSIYGEGHPNVETKRRHIVSMLTAYRHAFGDGDVLITRSPGRVNIMGRHVDHQGGHGNMIAIDRDFYMVVGPRKDRQVRLTNIETHQFSDREFAIDELLTGYSGGDWLDFVNGDFVRDQVTAAHGDWSQYAKAAIARFQARFLDRKFAGMDVLAAGDIPIAAGLSSSSAIVVAMAEALVEINKLDVTPEQFVELCGEGEWYVGTRGGAGDHAAMKFARKGRVVQVGFFPFGVADTVDFPADHVFVVCNSHERARKTAGARDVFNHRVACYNIGRELLKQNYPGHAEAIEHLRDVNVRRLGVEYTELLQMLKSLPVAMAREQITDRIPGDRARQYLSTHSDTFASYPIRSVIMFGLAECERSRTCPDLLRRGDTEEFGRWMSISHDGDRVVTWDKGGDSWPFELDYSDARMDEMIAKSAKNDLVLQPGAYSCSIPQIDKMVDIALSVTGVLGAQILGAGLGGCMLVLARSEAFVPFEQAMIKRFYKPARLEPDMFACYPVAGSGVASA